MCAARRFGRFALAGVALLVSAPAAAPGYAPRVDYALHCQGCHLADGSGTAGRIPALAGQVARFLAVPDGRAYLVQVPGTAQAPLDDAAIAALLNWLLAEFDPAHVPPDFRPYDASEVGALRRTPLLDAERTRRALLEALERTD